MLHRQRLSALLLMPAILMITICTGCSASLEETDASQLAVDEVMRTYPDPEQIVYEVVKMKRRADTGLSVRILVAPKEGGVMPNEHEIDITPDGKVVEHKKNDQDVPIEE